MANPVENTRPTTSRKQEKRKVGPPMASVSEEASTPAVPKTPKKSRWPFRRKKNDNSTSSLSPERLEQLLKQIASEDQENADNIPLGVEGKVDPKQDINTDFQRTFAGRIFAVLGKQTTLRTQRKYDQDPTAWAGSAANRTRLIVIEATDSIPVQNLAQATFDAKPLERVLITGLTPEKEVALQQELKKLWKNRAKKNQTREKSLVAPGQSKSKSEGENKIDKMSLETLLGPHLSQRDTSITYEVLEKKHPQFHVNIEEVLCYGENNQLAEDLENLGRKIELGVPTFSIRSKPFEDGETLGLWHCASKKPDEFLEAITKGETPTALLGKQADGSYAHVTLSDSYQKLLNLEGLKREMTSNNIAPDVVTDVEQKDVDYLGSILFDNCISHQGVTPKTLETTRAKASSIQDAAKAGELKSALKWNILDRPTSSAVEVEYAVGKTALDGGGDIISEDLKKRNAYRLFYEATLHALTEKGIDPKEAILVAYTQTLQAYVANEKKNKRIHELENGNTGAKAWRSLGLKYSNKVKKSNDKGIKALAPSMPLFVSAITGGLAWQVTSFVIKIATKVNVILGAISAGLSMLTFSSKAKSMWHQYKANRIELNITNDASAQANVKMLDAHSERKTALPKQLRKIQELLMEENGLDAIKGHVINNTAKIIQNPTTRQESKYPMLTSANKETMLKTLKTLRQQMPDIDPEMNVKVITAEGQLEYTKELYGKQAEISKQIAEKEYAENRISWMESGPNRARLLVLEANDQNLDQLATSVLEASPIERILIAGLTLERQPEFETKLKELWKEKLDTSEKKSNFETKLNEPLMASTREELMKLCAPTWEDGMNPVLASNFEAKFKELWEKTPIPEQELQEFAQTYGNDEQTASAISVVFPAAKAQQQSFEAWLDDARLEKLMGPHLYKKDLNLTPKEMGDNFPDYDTNIEEVLCVGTSSELAKNLDQLGQSIQSGVPVFSVKLKESAHEEGEGVFFSKLKASKPKEGEGVLTDVQDEGLWKCSCKNPTQFFKEIIKGKSASELIGPKTADGGYANIEMSAAFQELFQLEEMQKQMKDQQIPIADSLAQEDLEYIKKILFEEALCPGNMTPDNLEKINAKTITQLGSLAGEHVGDALIHNLYGNPKSTVVEVMLAIGAISLDAGGDMYRHQLAKKKAYALLFEKLKSNYSNATEPAMSPKEATTKALIDTVATYTTIEKNTDKMTKELHTTQEWRDLAVEKANQTKKYNDAAIKALKGSGARFVVGTAVSLGLLGLAATGWGAIPVALIIAASVTSTGLGVWQTAAVAKSTTDMIKANEKSLPQGFRAVNKVDDGEKEVHKLREVCIAEVFDARKQNTTISQALTTIQKKYCAQDEIDASEQQEQQEQEQAPEPLQIEHPEPSRSSSEEEKKEEMEEEEEEEKEELPNGHQNHTPSPESHKEYPGGHQSAATPAVTEAFQKLFSPINPEKKIPPYSPISRTPCSNTNLGSKPAPSRPSKKTAKDGVPQNGGTKKRSQRPQRSRRSRRKTA